jgi:nucleoside-triphosphatase
MEHKIIIITGEQGSGKTTFLQEMIVGLVNNGLKAGGILAEGFWKNYERDHFKLIDLKSKNSILFCQREPKEGWEKLRHFYINPDGQKFGEAALDPEYMKNSDIIVVDEIGPFELKGKGWANSIENLLRIFTDKKMIWVVRNSLLDEVSRHFKIQPSKIFHVEKVCSEDVVKFILEWE